MMPGTYTRLTAVLALLLGGAGAQAQTSRGPLPPQWPPGAAPAGFATPSNAAQQAGYNAPPAPAILPSSDARPISPPLSPPVSLPDRNAGEPLPLARRGQTSAATPATSTGGAVLTTAGSLAVVLCLFFAAAWVLRRGAPSALGALPGEVVEILGRAPLPGRHQMHLVRCGHKLLLVAVSAAGADTLTEITDPLEVDRLCGLCRESHPTSATATFRNLLNQFGAEAAPSRRPEVEDA